MLKEYILKGCEIMYKKLIGCVLALILILSVCVCATSCDDEVAGGGSEFEEME